MLRIDESITYNRTLAMDMVVLTCKYDDVVYSGFGVCKRGFARSIEAFKDLLSKLLSVILRMEIYLKSVCREGLDKELYRLGYSISRESDGLLYLVELNHLKK